MLPNLMKAPAPQHNHGVSFADDYDKTPADLAHELQMRRDSYASAFQWNVKQTNNLLFFCHAVVSILGRPGDDATGYGAV